jgi:hypothetical protein
MPASGSLLETAKSFGLDDEMADYVASLVAEAEEGDLSMVEDHRDVVYELVQQGTDCSSEEAEARCKQLFALISSREPSGKRM